MPLIFVLASLYMVLNALITEPHDTGRLFGLILAGVPVFWLWGWLRAPKLARQP
ncbi:MAG: hypothetical protein JO299_02270 [Gammaproteobacteria bacterium]|nr:hypothetical protein [Gammaproteobacteria bacterium]